MNVSRQTLLVNGLPVHYEVVGEGEPLVFLHGLSESSRVWYRNIPVLAKHYRVYLLDLPGFGAMRGQRKQFRLEQCAAWLDGWMQAMGLQSVSLVGHSMGGHVVMVAAAMRPEQVKRLVLVDSIGIPFHCSVLRLVYPALKAIARTTPAFWPCIAYDYLRAGPAMVWKAGRQCAELDELSALSCIRVPTLLIWGSEDDLIPLASGRQLHEHIPGSRLVVLPKANHFCMFEQPENFNQALLSFLQGQEVGFPAVTSSLSSR